LKKELEMAQETILEEELEGTEQKPLLEAARKLLLASIGAIALAQDELEDFVDKLVERGEIAEKDGRELMNRLAERGRGMAKRARSSQQTQVEDVLHSMDIPTRADIKALSNKISALAKKLDELKEK